MPPYPKPSGYDVQFLYAGNNVFRPYNRFLSGGMRYAPAAPTAQVHTLTFSAAPDDTSALLIPDVNPVTGVMSVITMTFTYAGSPGAGIIPLVAGGGTAAQAATAAMTAIQAQPFYSWIATNPSAGVLKLTSRPLGARSAPGLSGTTNATLATTESVFGRAIPGRFGKNYCYLPVPAPSS